MNPPSIRTKVEIQAETQDIRDEAKTLQDLLLKHLKYHPAIKQNEWKTVAICAILVAAIGWAAFGWLMVLEAGR
jgi:hypothetical protein